MKRSCLVALTMTVLATACGDNLVLGDPAAPTTCDAAAPTNCPAITASCSQLPCRSQTCALGICECTLEFLPPFPAQVEVLCRAPSICDVVICEDGVKVECPGICLCVPIGAPPVCSA
jgi:hypothetical protein